MAATTRAFTVILSVLGELGCAEAPSAPPAAQEQKPVAEVSRCANYAPERRAFYGDLHVHTAYSHDAWAFDTRATPEQAYRFARGEPLMLAPLDENSRGTRRIQLERPLDFAAVADHAEYFGPTLQCTDPSSPGYGTASCAVYREEDRPRTGVPMGVGMASLTEATYRRMAALSQEEVCGGDAAVCFGVTDRAWRATIAAAERWNDTSDACSFSALVGFEYSMTPDLTKIHRNVIFRSAEVPDYPISWAHAPTPWKLWQRLQEDCLDAGNGCDALTIPHNSNLSNGRLFEIEYDGAKDLAAEVAAAQLRQRMEPLMEMMQIKGDSECRNGMWGVVGSDELCDFEKFDFNVFKPGSPPPPDCEDGASNGALVGDGCLSRRDFYRYALADGLHEAERLGVNPFKVGAIASTDGHEGAPGDVEEYLYDGRNNRALNDFGFNPGGLAVVWAEENSRASLFDAMQRRETFGTSGPRMSVRFFGGWDYPEDLCSAPDLVARGYAGGVPMGSDLPSRAGEGGPVFVLSALADAGTAKHPGTPLQRIQIVKGWAEGETLHQSVHEVAGNADNGADVDPATCDPRGPGAAALCGVWRDPDFDPKKRAFYYARVVENPSCRYTARYCLNQAEADRPDVCSDPDVQKVIQERAWTSPIWYDPAS
jgi:hypothetical protein